MLAADHIQTVKPSYIREILQAATSPGVISLAGGLPATDYFPMELIQNSLENVSKKSGGTLCYELLNIGRQVSNNHVKKTLLQLTHAFSNGHHADCIKWIWKRSTYSAC